MINPSNSFDCAIVGGGPAGSLLATKLAEWGHKVALIDRGGRAGSVPEETMVPGAQAILKRNGITASIRAHDFLGTKEHGIVWGDGELRWRRAENEERGFQVVRKIFDLDMRNIARSHGVTLFENTRVPGPLPQSGSGSFDVADKSGKVTRLYARVIALAGGKQSIPELLPLSLERQLPRTAAIGTRVLANDVHQNFRQATVIEAIPQGWMWWLPLRNGEISVSLFCDVDELKAAGRNRLFEEALSHTSGPAAQLREILRVQRSKSTKAEPQEFLKTGRGAVATSRLLSTPSEILLLGDAASTIDPLSSQGIEKALSSAEQAAVAVNTILEDPLHRREVITRHQEWEAGAWEIHAKKTLGFYLKETRFSDQPFWQARHDMVRVEIETPGEPSELPHRLRPHPDLQERPTLRRKGNRYIAARGYALKRSRRTIESLGRVPLEPIIKHLNHNGQVEGFMEQVRSDPRLYLVSPRLIVQALTELLRLGMIVEAQEHPERG
ncbi:MAG: NAD(P)/FAD-dependent oxidoreductase [Planctomycetota bacterium]